MRSYSPDRLADGRALWLADRSDSDVQKPTVLVIDHDEAVRDALSVSLSTSDFRVLTFRNAGDFLQILPLDCRGCLLIEFDLEDMIGTELVARMVDRQIELPAIIMSGRLRRPVLADPLPPGIVGFLHKPFGRDEILAKLRLVLDRRR